MPSPTEDDIRDLFASTSPGRPLDARRIIARSRARRLPRQLAMGAIGTLAVAGIAVVGIQSIVRQPEASIMSQTDAAAPSVEGGQSFDTTTKRAPAAKINLCAGTVAEAAPSLYGLRLDVAFPETAPAGASAIQGTVHLTNTGSETVTGTTAAAPAITVSQGGVVLWHSNGPMIDLAVTVDLAPGQSMDYSASFTPVRCDVADDEAESFRADLPVLPAGGYYLSAAIDFQPDASMAQQGTPGVDLVTGPVTPITLK
ncbi:MAG: hypothetical protein JWP19_2314 [Rhodoglobus sp.]|nr:hypothetical protein [Rhodoglobus sp.]